MPLYEFECAAHGVFEKQRSISAASEPADCPECDEKARRILSAPNLACMPRSQVIARDRNEKSRHEPRVAQRSQLAQQPQKPVVTSGRPWAIEHC